MVRTRFVTLCIAMLSCAPAWAQTTTRVSVDSAGLQGNGISNDDSISADGRYVVFASVASNLVPGDTNEVRDIFVHAAEKGPIERAPLPQKVEAS